MNIKEIAKLANVSVSTVSRYLNDGYVSQKNRDKIKKIIDENNYIQNSAALNLKGVSNEIAVIVQRISSITASRFLEGVVNECIINNLSPTLYTVMFDENKQKQYIEDSIRKGKKGIIIFSFVNDFDIDYKNMIVIGQKSNTHSSMYTDGRENYYNLVKTTLEENKQIKKVCILGVDIDDGEVNSRVLGAEYACKELGVSYKTITTDFSLKTTNLDINKNIYYVAISDKQAYRIIKKANNLGYKPGVDYLISGYGNYETSELIGLTSIEVNYEELGRKAVQKIVNDDYNSIKIDAEIIKRDSTKIYGKK